LTSRTDPEAIAELARQRREREFRPIELSKYGQFEGEGPPPRLVDAEDGEAEEWEVEAKLHKGELKPTDLVDIGTGWQTLGECSAFMDICEELAKKNRFGPLWYWLAIAVVATAVAGLLFFFAARA
jgi:hypothetical protein